MLGKISYWVFMEKHPIGCSFQLLWLKEIGKGKGFGKS